MEARNRRVNLDGELPYESAREILQDSEAAASKYELHQMGVRPPLRRYITQTWERRQFIKSLATSKAYAENQNTYLGQMWSLLNPALNAIVYVTIFGFLLNARGNLTNTVAFIVIGTFFFRFFADSITAGAKSILNNLNLVRSLHFPRAVLPFSVVLSQLATLLPAMLVMGLFVLLSGLLPKAEPVPVGWRWFLLIPAVILVYVFSTGMAFFMARAAAALPDITNTLPFLTRLLMYGSGVLFPISHYVDSQFLTAVLHYQPVAVYLNLARQALMVEETIPLDPQMWLVALGWAIAALCGGFIYFWAAEGRYGRE